VKLTKTHVFLIGTVIGAIIVGVVHAIITSSVAPKDTPIVIISGSLHGKTDSSDPSGWAPGPGNTYQGTVHHDPKNNNGIDYLQFNLLQGNPPTATSTNGWAITAANTDAKHSEVKEYAVRLCSDPTCTASTRLMDGSPNKNQCGSVFAPFGNVYMGARSDSWLEPVKSGSAVRTLHYHDTNCDGAQGSSNESECDWPIQFKVETCNPITSKTYACMGKGCSVQVGTK
jgi:hypothetical protein